MGGFNSDVVNEKSFVVNAEDDHPHDVSVALGDGYSLVGDDLCVIVGHRARQHPDALYVVPVRGVNECSHLRHICPSCGSERIFDLCHRERFPNRRPRSSRSRQAPTRTRNARNENTVRTLFQKFHGPS